MILDTVLKHLIRKVRGENYTRQRKESWQGHNQIQKT